jgi:pimeloyl-ACP methyl ester carboxylesterase
MKNWKNDRSALLADAALHTFVTRKQSKPPRPRMRPIRWVAAFALLAVACSTAVRPADAAETTTRDTRPPEPEVVTSATQPPQPKRGPGGSAVKHRDWRVSEGGTGADAWYVFEPIDPQPRSAPVAVMLHGYYEFGGYPSLHEFIRHTVLRGSVVIYPRWQTGVAEPCPGPFDIEPCMDSAVAGIKGALRFLRADPSRVQPNTRRTIYFGLSFGGIIVTNLANRYRALGVPKPRAVFLDDPHDGGLTGAGEVALDDSLRGIPRDTLFVCHSGAEGVIAGAGMAGSSCNAVFPKLRRISVRNKSLVKTRPDRHGMPALSSRHGVCNAFPGQADAYDWNFCWRTFDALRTASVDGTDRAYALGHSAKHTDLGAWSDGVAVVPLAVRSKPR